MIVPTNRKHRVVVFVISTLALIIGLSLLWAWQTGRISFKAASDKSSLDITADLAIKADSLGQEIDAASSQLLTLLPNYLAAEGKAKDQLSTQMQQIAKTRQQKLKALLAIADDPHAANAVDGANKSVQLLGRLAFPDELQKSLATVFGVGQYLESTTSLSGSMIVEITEGASDVYRTEYGLTTSDGVVHELRFGINPGLFTGDQLNVTGITIGSVVVLAADSQAQLAQYLTVTQRSENLTTIAASGSVSQADAHPDVLVAPAVTKQVAVIAFNFQDNTTRPVTTAKLEQLIFTAPRSATVWYREVSEGRIELVGDVYGYYTLNINHPTACNTNTRAQMGDAAIARVRQELGREPFRYDYIMFVFPAFSGTNCSYGGAASVGGNRSYYPVTSSVQANDSWTRLPAHELGHNFGLDHAQLFDCRDSQNRRIQFSERTTCPLGEYDDLDDVMGGLVSDDGLVPGGSESRHFSGSNLNRLGWIANSQVQTVTQSGTYTLYPSNKPGSGTRLIRLPNTQTAPVYIEYRRPSGLFDNYSTSATSVNGVLIRRAAGTPPYKTQLLYGGGPHNVLTSYEAALPVNKRLTLDNSAIYIRTISVTPTSAQVEISYVNSSVCATHQWTQTVTPVSASVVSTSSPTKNYRVALRNTNQASCANSQVAPLVTSLTTGSTNLTKTVTPPSLTLAPGDLGEATVSITARSQTTRGRYSLNIKTVDPQNPGQPVESNVDFWVAW